jgi:hypothetical protein
VENTTGDLVGSIANTASNAEIEVFRQHATIDPGGTVTYYAEDRTKVSVTTFSKFSSAAYNIAIGASSPVFAVPNNSMGSFWVSGYNAGLGRRRVRVEWVSTAGAITFGTIDAAGAGVFTGPTAVGLVVSVSVVAANTNLSWEMHVAQNV